MNHFDHKKRDAQQVEQMFSAIASRYDFLNHVLSFGLDFGWRRKVAEETGTIQCRRILDVCTGTGDMAIELCKFWRGKAHIDGLDFSHELLEVARRKIRNTKLVDMITLREGNAEDLPYQDEQFDAITITFGLRNINDRLRALREFYRVARPGGCFVCLEFSQPRNAFFSGIYSVYLLKLVPLVSRLLGSNPGAYKYLGETIKDFPPPTDLARLISTAGWSEVTFRTLAGGIVALHRGVKY
ncbi:MAG: bifunctional demethylmenaquinone methyltransferase/2-methoxy-6-polyprenyl-1,4-benzoquinol methylase UbiE [Nitrospirota bacterium]